MKKFNYFFTNLIKVLIICAIILSVIGLGWNIFNLVCYLYEGAIKIISYSIIIALNLVLLLFTISILLFSRYEIDDKNICCRFGFITSKRKITEITQISLFLDKEKLVVYFDDKKYTIIIINPLKFDEFVETLRNFGHKFYYSVERDQDELIK